MILFPPAPTESATPVTDVRNQLETLYAASEPRPFVPEQSPKIKSPSRFMTLEQAIEIANNPRTYSTAQQKEALAVLTSERARKTDAALEKLKSSEDW